MKPQKIIKLLGIIFAFIGALFVVVGIFAYKVGNDFKKTAVSTKAEIMNIQSYDDSHNVLVEFDVDGQTYTGQLNYYDNSMYVGKEVTVYYNPDNPNDFRGADYVWGYLIFVLVGSIFFIIGMIFVIVTVVKGGKRKKIISYNYVVTADIIGIREDNSVSYNGISPYVMEASSMNPADGRIYFFKSEPFWQDVTQVLDQFEIRTIPVYVNPDNYAEYVMDLSIMKHYIGNFK